MIINLWHNTRSKAPLAEGNRKVAFDKEALIITRVSYGEMIKQQAGKIARLDYRGLQSMKIKSGKG